MLAFALLALLLVQAEGLVDRLGSDKIEERDDAYRRLKQLGKAAVPVLEKAAAGGDPEGAGRAKHLLRVIELQERLTPALRKAIPGVEERLAAGGDREWTRLFLEVGRDWQIFERRYPTLREADLGLLAGRALSAAGSVDERLDLIHVVKAARLRSAVPALIPYLQDPEWKVRQEAVEALGELDDRGAAPEIRKRLQDEHGTVRSLATLALGTLGSKESIPAIVSFLKDRDASVRETAADALVMLGSREAVPELLDQLKREDAQERSKAVSQLGWVGTKEEIPALRPLLKAESAHLRLNSAAALARLGSAEGFGEAVEQLGSDDRTRRTWAILVVSQFEMKSAAPALAKLLDDSECGAAAARGLCRLGSREGVEAFFRHWGEAPSQEDAGFSLNALRARETWDRLRKKEWRDSLEGTFREILERLAREAEMPLVWSPKAEGGEPDRLEPGWKRNRSTLLEALAEAGAAFGIVLEKDRIRVLQKKESHDFWRAWWEAERKK